ncbi:MAG TPA: cytochrome c [Bryobacteraceae bacterium]|nr:cytochrome c [Bryobacteraceae bacterium]
MLRSKGFRICAAVAVAACWAIAQDGEPAGGRGGRSGRGGGTRDFLGLGPAPDAAAAARGEKIYAPNCAFCHGEKARGGEGPNLIRSAVVLDDEKGELIAPTIRKGRPDQGMPAFPNFSDAELHDLAQYLHLQVELVANRGLYKRLNIVTGNAAAGEAYFNGAGGCKSCHSPTGDLAHIGSRYQPDQLQSRFVWPGGGRGAHAQKVAVTLTNGQTVTGTLRHIDDFDISLTDAAGNYRSWPRQAVKVEIEDRLEGHRKLLDKYTDRDMHDLTAYLVTLK